MKRIWVFLVCLFIIILSTIIVIITLPSETVFLLVDNMVKFLSHELENNFLRILLIYIVVYLSYVFIGLPGLFVLTILGGALFGIFIFPVTVCLFTLGSVLNFIVIRKYFKHEIKKFLGNNYYKYFKLINNSKNKFLYVLHLRILPISPYNILNMLVPLTSISVLKNMTTCFIGVLPNNFFYVLAGVNINKILLGESFFDLRLFLLLILFALIPIGVVFARRWVKF